MTNHTANEKVLKRIRHLYAMSLQNESSPFEAETALRRCQSLMQKYGITESDLESSEFDTTTVYRARKQMPAHVRFIASAVSLLHDCLAVNNIGALEFRGYEVDVKVANMTFDYLQKTMERVLSSAKRDGTVGAGRSASHEFRIGFCLEIGKRCKAIVDERKAMQTNSAGTELALVVVKMEMVQANCGEGVGKAKKSKYRIRSTNNTEMGKAAGRAVSLNAQVGGSSVGGSKQLG